MTTTLLENCTCGNCRPRGSTRGKKQVTIAELKTMVNAVCEQFAKGVAGTTEPEREVVGMYLTPRGADGKSGGKIVKKIRVGPREARQYMPHFATQDAP